MFYMDQWDDIFKATELKFKNFGIFVSPIAFENEILFKILIESCL